MNLDQLQEFADEKVEEAIELASEEGCEYVHIYLQPPESFPGAAEIGAEPSDSEEPEGADGMMYVDTYEVAE